MLDIVWVCLKVFVICVTKAEMRLSMLCGGRGARQFDLIRRVLGSYLSRSSPAKKTRRFRSHSNRDVLTSMTSGVMLSLGVGINLRPRPRMWCAVGGSL